MNDKEDHIIWASHNGFAMDENHYRPADDLSDDEWREIQSQLDDYAISEEDEEDLYDYPFGNSGDPELQDDCDDDLSERYDPDVITLASGTILMRYGSENGCYYTDPGTPFEQLALPGRQEDYQVSYYKVEQPLQVHSGTVHPWFGKEGNGPQYKTLGGAKTIDLLDSGILSRCTEEGEPKKDPESTETGSESQGFFENIMDKLDSLMQKYSRPITIGLSAMKITNGFHQFAIDLKKIENIDEPSTRIECLNEAWERLGEEIADDDLEAVLKKANETKNTDNNETDNIVDKRLSALIRDDADKNDKEKKVDITDAERSKLEERLLTLYQKTDEEDTNDTKDTKAPDSNDVEKIR